MIINAHRTNDKETLRHTTLMVKNIPARLTQAEIMSLFDEKFQGTYDYFYLPIDRRTKQSCGFCFINMVDAIFILDFYLEFNCIKWSDRVPRCQSPKMSEIVYATVQGLDELVSELKGTSVMNKCKAQKPLFLKHNMTYNMHDRIVAIENKYLNDARWIAFYKDMLKWFSTHKTN